MSNSINSEWTAKTFPFLFNQHSSDSKSSHSPKSQRSPIIPIIPKEACDDEAKAKDSSSRDKDWSLEQLLSRSAKIRGQTQSQRQNENTSPSVINIEKEILPGEKEVDNTANGENKLENPRSRRPDSAQSTNSSISWAEDAHEHEQTSKLGELWADIEAVCSGAPRPQGMSLSVYQECLEWRKAFPNHASHFSHPNIPNPTQSIKEVKSIKSPVPLAKAVSNDNDDKDWSLAKLLGRSDSAKESRKSLSLNEKNTKYLY